MTTLKYIHSDDSIYSKEISLIVEFSSAHVHQCTFKKGDSPVDVALMLKALSDKILRDQGFRTIDYLTKGS